MCPGFRYALSKAIFIFSLQEEARGLTGKDAGWDLFLELNQLRDLS
jgi:hypothetical protein